MADAICQFRFGDQPDRVFELNRITRSELSHFKQWYGADYGQKITIITKAIWQDGDAIACLMWSCRRQNGLTLEGYDPRNMPDFDPDDVLVVKTQDELEREAATVPLDQTGIPSDLSTKTSGLSGSTEEIPTNSGGSGSPSLDTSVT